MRIQFDHRASYEAKVAAGQAAKQSFPEVSAVAYCYEYAASGALPKPEPVLIRPIERPNYIAAGCRSFDGFMAMNRDKVIGWFQTCGGDPTKREEFQLFARDQWFRFCDALGVMTEDQERAFLAGVEKIKRMRGIE